MLNGSIDEIRHKHRKREDKPAADQATITAADAHIEVYLDDHGNVASSSTVQGEPAATGLERRAQAKQIPVEAAGSAPGANGQISFKSGVTYSPYNTDQSCKSASQVARDLKESGDFEVIRLYGVSTGILHRYQLFSNRVDVARDRLRSSGKRGFSNKFPTSHLCRHLQTRQDRRPSGYDCLCGSK